jgi:hypothetical protein
MSVSAMFVPVDEELIGRKVLRTLIHRRFRSGPDALSSLPSANRRESPPLKLGSCDL